MHLHMSVYVKMYVVIYNMMNIIYPPLSECKVWDSVITSGKKRALSVESFPAVVSITCFPLWLGVMKA